MDNFSKIFVSGFLKVLNNLEVWKFSKQEISLYVIANSDNEFMWKGLVSPGWAKSWPKAVIRIPNKFNTKDWHISSAFEFKKYKAKL